MKSFYPYDFEIQKLIKDKHCQMRRVCKINNDHFWSTLPGYYTEMALVDTQKGLRLKVVHCLPVRNNEIRKDTEWIKCPFGAVGEKIWCKETWTGYEDVSTDVGTFVTPVIYKADSQNNNAGWKSPVTMPHEASRLTIVPERIWVELLQKMSSSDAIYSGITRDVGHQLGIVSGSEETLDLSYQQYVYKQIWDRHNEPGYKFADNPMVWCAEVMTK